MNQNQSTFILERTKYIAVNELETFLSLYFLNELDPYSYYNGHLLEVTDFNHDGEVLTITGNSVGRGDYELSGDGESYHTHEGESYKHTYVIPTSRNKTFIHESQNTKSVKVYI